MGNLVGLPPVLGASSIINAYLTAKGGLSKNVTKM